MWTLGLDTATWTASVGIDRDGVAVAQRTERVENTLAAAIIPLIDGVLTQARIAISDLDAIAVSAGPGSFTGLRVGLSTAKGLAYAANAHLVAVPTLEALARALGPRTETVWTILDARRSEIYAASFRWRGDQLDRVVAEMAIAPRELARFVSGPEDVVFIGDGVDEYQDVLIELFGAVVKRLPLAAAPPSGAAVAAIGRERLAAGVAAELASVEPFYVRASEAERKFC
ncbi:MAG: tRNA (adenosine(37)-N6)-threonylcarbamoyltransferase complex dimerization subunit type 1 TsaB [Deltaproteobacteria bacterium]|nr:tRNA (adenosine(37)-N6)-threonylcarbamoyltransferase complex dimerization subunit type 1 TsaB [Deltaproteobacteria bacterium]MBI3388627.1 tRNA (adenosine(37)-N6)-threonylcarbamoyltransferase complex dimerization subunit type 1 TsaB [Deltaproteobacteria bacterium]